MQVNAKNTQFIEIYLYTYIFHLYYLYQRRPIQAKILRTLQSIPLAVANFNGQTTRQLLTGRL